ncbi:MAG: hypothetical protein M5U28_01820 [Sandaracinaceae bacterium]|nr:hypothetical protein [Sandaracinaceae bacterium]
MHVETTRRAGAHPIHRRRVTCTRRRGFEHLLAACLGVLAALCALAPAASAQDVSRCPSEIVRWAEACGSEPPRLVECPGGHAIFAVGPGRLRVDVTRRPEGAFVSLPSLGVSPVGEFSDWSEVPAADRAAFDALVQCARERPEALVGSLAATPAPPSGERPREAASAPSGPLPWKIVLAAAVALLVLVQRFGVRGVAERAAPLLALGAVTMLARVLLVPESYFHQNGHGPSWIAHALGEPSSYGPGYAEVLYWAAIRAADPDAAVFLVQGALAALVPGAAYAMRARRGRAARRGVGGRHPGGAQPDRARASRAASRTSRRQARSSRSPPRRSPRARARTAAPAGTRPAPGRPGSSSRRPRSSTRCAGSPARSCRSPRSSARASCARGCASRPWSPRRSPRW